MSDKMRWGIVGCGDITNKRVAPALNDHPECEVVAFCSSSMERARDFAERHGARTAYDDLDAFLREDLDCVYVASRVFQHAEQTIRCLDADKHVLCEKPLAMNAGECDAMLAAEERSGRRLGCAYYRRYYPAWERAKEIAKSGALGDLVVVRIMLSSFWEIDPEDPKYWRVRRKYSGGGPLADIGSHRLDLLVDLLDTPAQVGAFMETRHHEDWDVEDCCILAMRMRGGVQAEAGIFGNVAERRDEFEVYGTRGAVLLPGLGTEVKTFIEGNGRSESLPLHKNVHYPLIEDFVRYVQTGRAMRSTGREGAKTTRVIDAAVRSAESSTIVLL